MGGEEIHSQLGAFDEVSASLRIKYDYRNPILVLYNHLHKYH